MDSRNDYIQIMKCDLDSGIENASESSQHPLSFSSLQTLIQGCYVRVLMYKLLCTSLYTLPVGKDQVKRYKDKKETKSEINGVKSKVLKSRRMV